MGRITDRLLIRVIPFNLWCENSLKELGILLTNSNAGHIKAFDYTTVYNDLALADNDYLPDVILLNEEKLPSWYDRSIFEIIALHKINVTLVLHRKHNDRYKAWVREIFCTHFIIESTEQSLGRADQLCRDLSLARHFSKEKEYYRKLDEYYEDWQGVDSFLEDKLELLNQDKQFFQWVIGLSGDSSSYEALKYDGLMEQFKIEEIITKMAKTQDDQYFKELKTELFKKLFIS